MYSSSKLVNSSRNIYSKEMLKNFSQIKNLYNFDQIKLWVNDLPENKISIDFIQTPDLFLSINIPGIKNLLMKLYQFKYLMERAGQLNQEGFFQTESFDDLDDSYEDVGYDIMENVLTVYGLVGDNLNELTDVLLHISEDKRVYKKNT